jgi:hypothetical protein
VALYSRNVNVGVPEVNEASPPRYIFVLGAARTGTTAVSLALNTDPECFILLEGDMFTGRSRENFRNEFNSRKLNQRTLCGSRGSYLPAVIGSPDPDRVLPELQKHFRRVGEKVALGPNWSETPLLLEYLSLVHLESDFILTIRWPDAVISSQHKMFPAASPRDLLCSLVKTLIIQLTIATHFKRVRFIFHDHLSSELLNRLGADMDLPISLPEAAIGGKHIKTKLKYLGREWASIFPILEVCRDVYNEMHKFYDPSTFRIENPAVALAPFEHLTSALDDALSELAPGWSPIGSGPDAAPDPLLERLRECWGQGEIASPEALAIGGRLMDRDPHHAEGACLYAIAAHRNGRLDDAEAAFARSLAAGHPPFWVGYHRIPLHLTRGAVDAAREELERIEALRPDSIDLTPLRDLLAAHQPAALSDEAA